MPFREPLDLGDILPAHAKNLGVTARADRLKVDEEAAKHPVRIGGQAVCSSSRALATVGPGWVWDANDYYKTLGVTFRATRGELREGYQRINGQDDAYATFCLKQLLNDEIRAAYDATPLGQFYLDEWVADRLKQNAIREAARRSQTGLYSSPEEVLGEWGLHVENGDDQRTFEDMDRDALRAQDDASQVEYQGQDWQFGYYLWRTTKASTERLRGWQTLLVEALDDQGATVHFAVGQIGKEPHPYVIGIVGGGVYVVFLQDSTTPDPEVASRAASALLREMERSRQLTGTDGARPMDGDEYMSDAATKPKFGKGGKAAADADEAVRKAFGSKFRKTPFLAIDDGDYQIVRYITDSDDWTYVKQHGGVPTKNKPEGYTGTWPDSMPATCRYDEAFEGIYSDCYIDDAGLTNKWGKPCRAQVRVWALAVLREEVIGTQEMADAGQIPKEKVGFLVGCRDVFREVEVTNEKGEATGEKKQELAVVLVNFAVSNYFEGLQAAYGTYGTICDRDFKVDRKGSDKDTEYHNISLDPTPKLKPGTEKWQKYIDAVAEQKIDIDEIIAERASDDFFARFFDPNKTPSQPSTTDNGSAPAAQQAAAPSNDPDPDRLAAIRDRVKGGNAAAAPAAPAEPVAAAPAVDFD